jgi:hypothetical protein
MVLVALVLGGNGRVRYVVDGDSVSIETGDFLTPTRTVALDNVTAVETIQLRRGRRVFGTEVPGYCVGRFSYEGAGQVWQATDCSEHVVVLRLRDEAQPIVIAPADAAVFVEALRNRRRIEARPAVTLADVTGWRWVLIGALGLAVGAMVTALAMCIAEPEWMRDGVVDGDERR